MGRILAFLSLLTVLPVTGFAQADNGCSKTEQMIARNAIQDAKRMTVVASTAVADTPEFNKWFGTYSQARAETVRATLKSAVDALRSGRVRAQCVPDRGEGCEDDIIAWVTIRRVFVLNLCPGFFALPLLDGAAFSGGTRGDSTQEGTILHELTHFDQVGQTEDYCYARNACEDMADARPDDAIMNADSYQFFAEDVVYLSRRQRPAGKSSKVAP